MTIPWFQVLGGVPLVEDVYFEFETARANCWNCMNSSSAILMRSLSLRRRACVGTECDIVRVVGFPENPDV